MRMPQHAEKRLRRGVRVRTVLLRIKFGLFCIGATYNQQCTKRDDGAVSGECKVCAVVKVRYWFFAGGPFFA
jgi:hypothetical protein